LSRAVIDALLSPDFQLGYALEVYVRHEDGRCIEERTEATSPSSRGGLKELVRPGSAVLTPEIRTSTSSELSRDKGAAVASRPR
jgi:hypothetical protein